MNERIIINDLLISYEKYQDQSGLTLLFLHGWRSSKEVWSQVVSSMYQVASVYALDLPGFGGSPAPKESWSVGDYAKIVKGFIEKLELKNIVLVGHSFGGRVGIKLAAMQNTTSPLIPPLKRGGKIEKLVLVDSAGFAMPSNKKSLMNAAAKLARPFFKPKFMQGLRKKVYQTIGAEDYLATPELQKTFVNIVNEDLTEDMKKITIPTLIIFGENDMDTPPSIGKKMHSLIPNSKFIILNDAGHFSFLDQATEFVKKLIDFIS